MRKQLVGVVTSDKTSKTRRVEVKRLYAHPKYGKIVRGRTICHAHDEQNTSKRGDEVEIVECRPRSATKRWELVKVLKQANPMAVVAADDAAPLADPSATPSTTPV